MTDEMLARQTERFTERATFPVDRLSYVVHLRSEQVGGVALRFACVVRYRGDERADEADTISTVQSLR